jgi:hypothetical protein
VETLGQAYLDLGATVTMKTKVLICLVALLGVSAVVNRLELPVAKVTVRVLDEEGKPVSAATVKLGFRERLTGQDIFVTGLTDSNGRFAGEGGCAASGMGNEIRKDGYYEGWAEIPKFSKIDSLANRWQPWDETYVTVLRPVINPVAMFAKTGWFDIPVADQPCGYDLQLGDWVAPYGTGSISDFVFTLNRHYANLQDFAVTVELRFTNPLDGIQVAELPASGRNSRFKWPREAPKSGYGPMLLSNIGGTADGGIAETAKDNDVYFFRVRTVEKNGRIVSALYGKIKGGVSLAPMHSKTCKVQLTYYLNPTPLDRNVEWDPKRNLLSGLNWEENPRDP